MLGSARATAGQPQYSALGGPFHPILAVPIGSSSVVFAWQTAEQSWLSQDQVEVIQFLTQFAAMLESDMQNTDEVRRQLDEAEVLHRRWLSIFRAARGLALNWQRMER